MKNIDKLFTFAGRAHGYGIIRFSVAVQARMVFQTLPPGTTPEQEAKEGLQKAQEGLERPVTPEELAKERQLAIEKAGTLVKNEMNRTEQLALKTIPDQKVTATPEIKPDQGTT